jgi:hypothetical protein
MVIPPFKHIVDNSGYYTEEYIKWAIQKDNFVGSDLHHAMYSYAPVRSFGNVKYILGIIEETQEHAILGADKIRKLGGIAKVTSIKRNKNPMFAIWFNPNGSMKAYQWILNW